MILIIQNQINEPRSYLSGSVSLAVGAALTASSTQIFPLSRDPVLINDCMLGNVFLSDGTNMYTGASDCTGYLNAVATSLGSAVIGYLGQPAPSFAILVGSKDQSGNIQAATISSVGGIIIDSQIASGAADSGNPIKVGGVYNSSLPSLSTGQRVDAQANQLGELAIQYRNQYSNIVGNTTVTVKSGAGRLHGVMINRNWTGGTIVIYDNTAASGTKIATLDMGTPSGGLLSTTGTPGPVMLGPLGLEFGTGLTVVTSGSSSNNITILYQ